MPRMQGNLVTIGGQANNYFFIDWTGTDNAAANTTTINWAAYFHFTLSDSQLDNGDANLNGVRWDVPGRVYNFSSNFTTRDLLLASGSFVVTHNAAGEATLNVSGGVVPIGSGGSSGSASYALTNYSRPPLAPASATVAVSGRNATVTSGVADVTNRPAIIRYEVERTSNDGVTWLGSVETMDGSRQFTYVGLDGGKSYKFRTRAVNADGNGAFTESALTFIPAGGKRWNGSAWVVTTTAKRWTGSAWTDIQTAKRWSGSAWVDLS